MFRNCEGQSHKTVSLISLTVSVDGKHHVLLTNTGHASVDVTEAAKTHTGQSAPSQSLSVRPWRLLILLTASAGTMSTLYSGQVVPV